MLLLLMLLSILCFGYIKEEKTLFNIIFKYFWSMLLLFIIEIINLMYNTRNCNKSIINGAN